MGEQTAVGEAGEAGLAVVDDGIVDDGGRQPSLAVVGGAGKEDFAVGRHMFLGTGEEYDNVAVRCAGDGGPCAVGVAFLVDAEMAGERRVGVRERRLQAREEKDRERIFEKGHDGNF